MSTNGKLSTYKGKLDQATREAKATMVALLATIAAWVVLGFGLAGLDVQLFHTPIWVLGGTVGTWLFSIAVCVFLEKRVFVDIDLDSIEPTRDVSGAVAPASASGSASAHASASGSASAPASATGPAPGSVHASAAVPGSASAPATALGSASAPASVEKGADHE